MRTIPMQITFLASAALVAAAILSAGLLGGRYSHKPVSPGNPQEDRVWVLDRLTGKLFFAMKAPLRFAALSEALRNLRSAVRVCATCCPGRAVELLV
jgi:hypothetical protein